MITRISISAHFPFNYLQAFEQHCRTQFGLDNHNGVAELRDIILETYRRRSPDRRGPERCI
ncbi:uncharacterized protein METZ01_LOCUS227248 [marine metagenome]|uniref:Uncharacterized protein n=1 Tax=marine metagenome TaxID=408172 RepID=A0A382GI66_9ZZZZ